MFSLSGNYSHWSFLNMDNSTFNNENDSTSSSSNGNSSPPLDTSARTRQLNMMDSLLDITGEGAASTPRIVRAQRNRHLNDISQPIELVDLSNIQINDHIRPAARFVEAVIDLCTPPRVTGYINLSDNDERSTNIARRTRRSFAMEAAGHVDNTSTEGPSPPKRERSDPNVSSEKLYKCPVCLDDVRQREPCTTRCGHIFCKECIESAVRSTHKCPLCNKKITARQLIRIYL